MKSFYLANADVRQTANMIRTLVKTRDIFIDEKLSLLVIKDTPNAVRLAERLVAAQDLAEPEVTGGYLFKRDRTGTGEGGFDAGSGGGAYYYRDEVAQRLGMGTSATAADKGGASPAASAQPQGRRGRVTCSRVPASA